MKNKFLNAILNIAKKSKVQETGTFTDSQETDSFTDSRDGKIYKTAKIGNQIWMAENLAYKASSGCWVYNDDERNVATYGYLYDWETAKKVCPKGWHLPNKDEWQNLIDYLGGKDIAGGKLKSTSGWSLPKSGATNESGFSALPGGFGDNDGDFDCRGDLGYWWSATADNTSHALRWALVYHGVHVNCSSSKEDNRFSVRCLKDK